MIDLISLISLLYSCVLYFLFFFFFKQKTAYEMRISDWSSDVCSSDLVEIDHRLPRRHAAGVEPLWAIRAADRGVEAVDHPVIELVRSVDDRQVGVPAAADLALQADRAGDVLDLAGDLRQESVGIIRHEIRSEEHTSELQSLMRISYAVFGLKKKN